MPITDPDLQQRHHELYNLRQDLAFLERVSCNSTESTPKQVAAFVQKQQDWVKLEQEIAALESRAVGPRLRGMRGPQTTGLEAVVHRRMTYVPTAMYHLLEVADQPLLTCEITNYDDEPRRVRVSTFIENYSARDVETAELDSGETVSIDHLPTLFADRTHSLTELTRATVNVLIDDLDTGKVEKHITLPIWLLARNSAPVSVKDEKDGKLRDLSRYLGAFVTPNEMTIQGFLSRVTEAHPEHALRGYQLLASDPTDVRRQVEALFTALQHYGLEYVHSVLDINPNTGMKTQRVRLPSETLKLKKANCIDGVLLFASLLQAMSLNACLVILPLHVLVGWEGAPGSKQWRCLDTTKLSQSFDKAHEFAENMLQSVTLKDEADPDQVSFYRWSLRDLRSIYRIFPME